MLSTYKRLSYLTICAGKVSTDYLPLSKLDHFWNNIHLGESVEGRARLSSQDVNQHFETYKLD